MKAYQFSVQGDLRRICADSIDDAEVICCDTYGGFDVSDDGKALCKRCNSICGNCIWRCSRDFKAVKISTGEKPVLFSDMLLTLCA